MDCINIYKALSLAMTKDYQIYQSYALIWCPSTIQMDSRIYDFLFYKLLSIWLDDRL